MEQENDQEEQARKGVTNELRMKKTQHMTASKYVFDIQPGNTVMTVLFIRRFVEVMTEYNQIQVDYREASKQKIKRQMELAGQKPTDEELEQMLEGGGGARLTGHIQIEGDAAQLRQTLNDIEQRHEMFIKLETSIKELHEMFMDISVLIENQGEMVNRIDVHLENAEEYTKDGIYDTGIALEYQQKARRKKIMMLICVVIGGSIGTYACLKYLGLL